MYLIVDENPNCATDERVFSTSGEKRAVKRLHLDSPLTRPASWCDVAAVEAGGAFGTAFAQRVEDSSDGTAWLVFGGAWGLRLKTSGNDSWSLQDNSQWGKPFLVLDSSGAAIDFA